MLHGTDLLAEDFILLVNKKLERWTPGFTAWLAGSLPRRPQRCGLHTSAPKYGLSKTVNTKKQMYQNKSVGPIMLSFKTRRREDRDEKCPPNPTLCGARCGRACCPGPPGWLGVGPLPGRGSWRGADAARGTCGAGVRENGMHTPLLGQLPRRQVSLTVGTGKQTHWHEKNSNENPDFYPVSAQSRKTCATPTSELMLPLRPGLLLTQQTRLCLPEALPPEGCSLPPEPPLRDESHPLIRAAWPTRPHLKINGGLCRLRWYVYGFLADIRFSELNVTRREQLKKITMPGCSHY